LKRLPEDGAMVLPEEVESYDNLSKNYLTLVEKKFVGRLVELLPEEGSQRELPVLDVGAGTANIPIRLVRGHSRLRIVALDLSWNMLHKARMNLSEAGLAGRILPVCARADQIPFKAESFDLVYSHSMLHHLPDPLGVLNEIARVTGQGRRFIVRDLRRPPVVILELYVRTFGASYDPTMKKMYRESLRAGYTFREFKELAGRIRKAKAVARRFFITHVGIEGKRLQT